MSQPFKDVWSSKVQGCAYGDYVFNSKNCYLSFELGGSQDCGYLDNCMKCIDCFDCSGCKFSQLCSDGLYLEKSYNCHHSQHLSNCSDCFYSAELFNCQHCFGCYALKHKQYYIFNQPRTKQEYATELPGLLSDPAAAAVRCSELRRTIGVVATHIRQSQDCSGDYIFNSHNCYHCFDINNNHDSAYLYDCLFHSGLSDCFDIDGAGGCELSSNCFSVGNSYNIHHCVLCSNLNDCSYCARCRNLKNCFGCVYLKDKQYYIFNQPYSAEDYHREVARLQGEFQRQGVSDMYSLVYGG
ncbi:hypothetical protein HY933_01850 [Candidatus Falkowbacteria bacterium]|nr:hypothetical protein [Candidatus Falkowbacteria bacterium]